MTILNALRTAEERLRVTQARLDAQVLLAHVLGKGTAYLFAHGEDALTPAQEEQFFALIARRLQHEPVAYILGRKAFYGREFLVTPDVLIPRPDSEVLVEEVKKTVGASSIIVDVGTGSGALATTLALETHRPVVALDNSAAALAIAEHNAALLGARNVIFLEGHLLAPLIAESAGERLGEHLVIVANLPYISAAQYATLEPDVKDYEPTAALVSGPEGLDHYDALLAQAAKWRERLPPRVDILMEIDPSQKHSLPQRIRTIFPAADITVTDDLARRPRVVHATLAAYVGILPPPV